MGGVAAVIDCDMHLMEPRDLWASYADPSDRDLALRLTEDELGHTWLVHGARRLELAFRQRPGETEAVGRQVLRARRGEPAEHSYDELHPPVYTDPDARLGHLDEQGIDEAVLFPNYGLAFELPLADDVRSLEVNMAAWNRYAVEVAQQGHGRLHPVGHLTLRDPEWLEIQLGRLAAGGVRLAMVAPALVEGRRLSHPDLDRVWGAFVDHGITPVFHVGAFQRPFDAAWYEDDPDEINPVLSSVFLSTPAALALADLAVHGVFAKYPDLRLGVMELSALWVPLFLLSLDGGFDFHARFNGEPLRRLDLKPSEYVRQHVRVAAFAYESPDRLTRRAGDMFMACSDFPHSEGTATMLADYARMAPGLGGPTESPGFFGDNVSWLLRR